MDGAELELLDTTLRRATDAHSGGALDEALGELGWLEAFRSDRRSAVSLLFEHQGRAGATSSALDDVLGSVLGLGEPGSAVVLPPLGTWGPPATGPAPPFVAGLGTARLGRASSALVVAGEGDELSWVQVPTAELDCRPLRGIDPELGLVEVTGRPTSRTAGRPLGRERWELSLGVARLAVAHELVGASGAMLELARVHALERVQFGRPIAAFQAVRHRLADTLVAIESARSLLDCAWEDMTEPTAAMAKAVAGRAARAAVRHCQQVLAGIGFTTEHRLHRYVRRVLVLDELFGSARSLTAALGREVLAARRLPTSLPL